MKLRGLPLSLLFMCLAPGIVFGQGRPGVNFSSKLIDLVPNVYAYEGALHLPGQEEIVRTNSLVIVTTEGVVIVDGQDNAEEGNKLIDAVRKVTNQPIRFLINASPHGDHVNSNNVFAGATLISHTNARVAMKSASEAAAPANRPRLPGIVFDDAMTLFVGGKTIELRHFGLGHTRGDTVVYLPEDKVAFLSELYFNGVFASLSEGYAGEHLSTLERAMKLDASWFIPGHGNIDGQTPQMLRAGLNRYYDNIKTVHDAVKRHVDRGDSLDKTLADIDSELGEFAKIPFYSYLKRGCITGTYNALNRK